MLAFLDAVRSFREWTASWRSAVSSLSPSFCQGNVCIRCFWLRSSLVLDAMLSSTGSCRSCQFVSGVVAHEKAKWSSETLASVAAGNRELSAP